MKNYIAIILFSLFSINASAQLASISEKRQMIKTYPFFDPNPVPSVGVNDRIARFYPYFMFDGYTMQSEMKKWNIVTLENPFIKVLVLPEVGGKVLGAIEKSTGNEFIYLNHVLKFRSIGIRGPWTSGGIEHNFGLDLGHAPWTASPVDYIIKNYPDGSVSCIVGGLDLASRSRWSVDIHLPSDEAYFITKALWYNPNPHHDSYLSWENAAYKAADDLEFFFPGTHYIEHDGTAHPWPIDEKGRNLTLYKNNNFGSSKSYHVLGNYRNWFGAYWNNSDFGTGHWAPYDDAPGKKIWIWSLARDGAIWEDLLTDEDGQYIEAQSGVKFNQAAENSGFKSPFKQLFLRPYYAETKTEYWFPVKETKGIVDATPEGCLNVIVSSDSVKIFISPNVYINDSLIVKLDNKKVYSETLHLKPMQVYCKSLKLQDVESKSLEVFIGKNMLEYSSIKEKYTIDRPVNSYQSKDDLSAERLYLIAEDTYAMRNKEEATDLYKKCLSKEPNHSRALTRLAEIYYRKGLYEIGLSYANKVLETNTYDGGANFIYGVIQKELGNVTKAEEAFSIAARFMEYRSASFAQLTGIQILKQDMFNAIKYAQKALDYNTNNLLAYEALITAYRKNNESEKAKIIIEKLLNTDPLNHYAHFEQYLLAPTADNLNNFKTTINNEFPHETYLELAIQYATLGLISESINVLEQAPSYPGIYYWLAYLKRDTSPLESDEYLNRALELSPAFVFPFRIESIPVLQWAQEKNNSWKTTYYLGLIYWNMLRIDESKELFDKCGDKPDYAPFYIARGILFKSDSTKNTYTSHNFKRAIELDPQQWRTWFYLIKYYEANNKIEEQVNYAEKAYKLFINNPMIGMEYAKSLMNASKFQKSLDVLNKINILPQEGAREGHDIYEMVNLALATYNAEQKKYKAAIKYATDSKKWPEHLGAGMPYNPDTRLHDFILAYCEMRLGNQEQANKYYNNIINYSLDSENSERLIDPINDYIGAMLLKKQGKQKEATQLMEKWNNLNDILPLQVKWVLEKFNNENKNLNEIEKQIIANNHQSRFSIFLKIINLM